MKVTSNIKRKIVQQDNLRFELLESGDIFSINYNHFQINLLRGNYIDGQAANIYLKTKINDEVVVQPLIGLKAHTQVLFKDNQVIYQGHIFKCPYQVTLTIYHDRWYYDVLIPKNEVFQSYSLYYGQDVGIQDRTGILASEAYTAQYIDHAIYEDNQGFTIQSRQNQGVPQFLQIGSLNETIGYATDGFQVFKTSYKLTQKLEGLYADLPNQNDQYEFPYITLQSKLLSSSEDQVFTFFGYYEPERSEILSTKLPIEHNHEIVQTWFEDGNFETFHPIDVKLITAKTLDSKTIKQRYQERRHVEIKDKNTILSFFTNHHVHVVLKEKEKRVLRPHGHLLISGDLLSGTEKVFGTTNWMFGLFASHIVLGNTNIQKFTGDLRNHLNVQTISGLRIYLKDDTTYHLLGVPSIYEMGAHYARWIYELKDDTIIVTTYVHLNAFGQRLEFKSVKGKLYDLVMTNQLVFGDHEYSRDLHGEIEGHSITFSSQDNDFIQSQYPHLKYQMKSHQAVTFGTDDCLFGESMHQGLLTLSYHQQSEVILDILATFDTFQKVSFDFEENQKVYHTFLNDLTGIKLHHKKANNELKQLEDTIHWYTHNALVHFASPHGLEQSNGAAWGTRDVLQGPVELFMSAGRFDLVRMILLKVFSRQFIENADFPQWFMYDQYYTIQAHESHGDIIVWPLKALGDYLYATGDESILKEKVPFMSMEQNKWVLHDATLMQHLNKTMNAIQNSFVKHTHLPAYGGGDWDDTLQPANQKLTDHMVSGWTPILLYQALKQLANTLEGTPFGRRVAALKTRIYEDYHKYLIKDHVPAGFVVFEADHLEYLLHPSDQNTGLKYRLLPLTRSIIAGMVSKEQAYRHDAIIDQHLRHPDGIRLMDTAVTYRGGEKTYFQRAETAANFGREIGILYVHAHIRYIEAMAKLGLKDKAYEALFKINPIMIQKYVPNAQLRQSNVYFSSSDAAFLDRYQAKRDFERLRKGEIEVKGGWRLYSSGPGIYIQQLIGNILGLRFKDKHLVLDPVLPDNLKGLKITYHYQGIPLHITYHQTSVEAASIILNGKDITHAVINEAHNIYRHGGVIITETLLKNQLKPIEILIK